MHTISVSGGSGLNATYSSLTKAGGLFAALNANAQTGNSVVVSITADVIDENGANALNQGAWTSLTITPNGARTLSGAVTGILIEMNGADNVTINGLNASGNSLSISNSGTGASATIRFVGDASNNTITNCTLLGSATSANYGVVMFFTGTTTGNDNNTISNCTITAAGSNLPINGVASAGTSAALIIVVIRFLAIKYTTILVLHLLQMVFQLVEVLIILGQLATINYTKLLQEYYTTANTHYGIFINAGDGYTVSGNTIGYAILQQLVLIQCRVLQ